MVSGQSANLENTLYELACQLYLIIITPKSSTFSL